MSQYELLAVAVSVSIPVKPRFVPAAAVDPPGLGSAPQDSVSAPAAGFFPAPAPPRQTADHLETRQEWALMVWHSDGCRPLKFSSRARRINSAYCILLLLVITLIYSIRAKRTRENGFKVQNWFLWLRNMLLGLKENCRDLRASDVKYAPLLEYDQILKKNMQIICFLWHKIFS